MAKWDVQARRWRCGRFLYYAGLCVLFAAIAFYFGPNLILFGKLARLAPADFVPVVERECVPVVRILMRYERDHGSMPEDMRALIPNYLPDDEYRGKLADGEYHYWTRFNHTISYRFAAPNEGWQVRGPFVSGRIPAPPVTAVPHSNPTTRPG